MYISIDFDSNEALYIQLRNQIILAIVRQDLTQGQNLPSVRDMAEQIGINMHTVNKAYSVLRQEGYVQLDHRKGAMVSVDMDKVKAMVELQLVLARAMCKQVNREEVHELVDQIYDQYEECRRK